MRAAEPAWSIAASTDEAAERVALWADAVGEVGKRLGVILALAFAGYLFGSLLGRT